MDEDNLDTKEFWRLALACYLAGGHGRSNDPERTVESAAIAADRALELEEERFND
jgi:hypothetical protein